MSVEKYSLTIFELHGEDGRGHDESDGVGGDYWKGTDEEAVDEPERDAGREKEIHAEGEVGGGFCLECLYYLREERERGQDACDGADDFSIQVHFGSITRIARIAKK